MKIHAIQTGTVTIKTRQVQARGHGARRQLNMFVDRRWTEPLPIYAFAIEHPEGVIVVDTGETARSTRARLLPALASLLPLRAAPAGHARAGDRAAAGAARDRAGRRPPRRADPPAHRPRRRPAPLPGHRDPRLARGPRGRLRPARAPARLSERPLARVVRADRRRPRARRLRAVPAEPGAHERPATSPSCRSTATPPASSGSSSRTASTPSCSAVTAPTGRT